MECSYHQFFTYNYDYRKIVKYKYINFFSYHDVKQAMI